MRNVTLVLPLFLFLLGGITVAFGGVTHAIQHTAVVLEPNEYEARAQGDFILNRGGGVNVSGHFRGGIIEHMLDLEGFVGTGKTDFKLGAITEFNLLPDIEGQIGLAFFGGATYVNDDYGNDSARQSILVLTAGTIASKKFDVSWGSVAPYLGFQAETLLKSGDNPFPLTLLTGAEWLITDAAPWRFVSEFDADVADSVFLLSVGAAYRF